jgi:tetratricopeptide (TPR) repeat protein
VYDDQQPQGRSERIARDTADAAIAELDRPSAQPRFVWVHFYDPHYPYEPPEPFRSRYAAKPYLGEVAYMDEQLGRLVRAFEQHAASPAAILVVADHGEGLGDHGEAQHGNLLYQSTVQVPLLLSGPGVTPGVSDTPVSTRRVFDTVLDWAGLGAGHTLRVPAREGDEVVLGEGMKPFLEYGWQPQVMTVDGHTKAILAGKLEAYDLAADPGETHNLGGGTNLSARARKGLDDYPVPSPDAARAPETLDPEARQRLASLGYVGATAAPVVRKDAPRPADMAALFPIIDRASGLFSAGEYASAVPLLEQIRAKDPTNLDAALRLAVSHSSLGHEARAEDFFRQAALLAPKSQDVRLYLALHYARGKDWPRAVPLLDQIVAESPDRLTAIEALARLKVREGQDAMDRGDTMTALAAFERARALNPAAFRNDLELGVLYLDARRFDAARDALDRVPSSHPDYAMALFKRAQVAVLLHEPDTQARIAAARQHADATTRPLIERERLFLGRR